MTEAEELEQALLIAARWREIHSTESYGEQGRNLGILSRALLNARERLAREQRTPPEERQIELKVLKEVSDDLSLHGHGLAAARVERMIHLLSAESPLRQIDSDDLAAHNKHAEHCDYCSVIAPCPYCTSDNEAIRGTYYDQTCEGCVKRMGQR